MKKIPLYIDTDIGTDADDALALALALLSPEVNLTGVGTVSGDTELRQKIGAKFLEAVNYDAKIAAGCGTTLLRAPGAPKFGHEGKGIIENDPSDKYLFSGHAVDMLTKIISDQPEKINIVSIGPMTNLALALVKEPWISERIERIYFMGGCVYPEKFNEFFVSNVPELLVRRLETNLNSDPEAAKIVLESNIPLTMVPIEVTSKCFFLENDLDILAQHHTSMSKLLVNSINSWLPVFEEILKQFGLPEFLAKQFLHDPLTVASVFVKDVIRTVPLCIYTKTEQGIFQTLVDPAKKANIDVAIAVDTELFKNLLIERLS